MRRCYVELIMIESFTDVSAAHKISTPVTPSYLPSLLVSASNCVYFCACMLLQLKFSSG